MPYVAYVGFCVHVIIVSYRGPAVAYRGPAVAYLRSRGGTGGGRGGGGAGLGHTFIYNVHSGITEKYGEISQWVHCPMTPH